MTTGAIDITGNDEARQSRGAKRLTDGVRIGGGNLEESLGGSARAAGALLPFVEGADAHADELGELGLTKDYRKNKYCFFI